MLKLNRKQIEENKKTRMEIIDYIMGLNSPKALAAVRNFALRMVINTYGENPMTVLDLAGKIADKDLRRILKTLEKAEKGQRAIEQMQEAFTDALSNWEETEEESKDEL